MGRKEKNRKKLACGCVVVKDDLGTEHIKWCRQHTPSHWYEYGEKKKSLETEVNEKLQELSRSVKNLSPTIRRGK